MEKKPEKKCSINNVKIGHRYSLSDLKNPHFHFIIENLEENKVYVKFLDGFGGLIYKSQITKVWEIPFSSLERELM